MSENNLDTSLLNALKKSFVNSYKKSEKDFKRSSDKVDEINALIASQIEAKNTLKKYKVISKIINGSGSLTQGKFYNKRSNIAIIDKQTNKTVAVIEFKMPMNSILKNKTNAIENILGSTYNIRSNNIKVFWIYCIPKNSPVFKNDHTITGFNEWKEKNNEIFDKLYSNNVDISKELAIPNGFSLNIFETNYNKNAKTKNDIINEITTLDQYKKLTMNFGKNKKIINGLYWNSYNEFINFIWKEINNER